MVGYEAERETRLHTDASPEGMQATVVQRYQHEEVGEIWRPVTHTARSWTPTEKGYSQLERESNGVYTGIVTNRMYLQGTCFKVVVDHKPLVPLYNGKARPKQPRADRHLMKLPITSSS